MVSLVSNLGSRCRWVVNFISLQVYPGVHLTGWPVGFAAGRDKFIHLVVCLTTGPNLIPKRALHIVRSRASSFK